MEKELQKAWCRYRNMEYVEGHVAPLPSDNFEKGYIMGATEALANQWRSVEDELPKENTDVLVAYTDHITGYYPCISIGNYDDIEGKWYSADDDVYVNRHSITHWMNIPKLK